MRATTVALLSASLAIIPGAIADHVIVSQYQFGISRPWIDFHTDYGWWRVHNVEDGCQRPPVPYMEVLCLDASNHRRGHFRFQGQGNRCLLYSHVEHEDNGVGSTFDYTFYYESPCAWDTSPQWEVIVAGKRDENALVDTRDLEEGPAAGETTDVDDDEVAVPQIRGRARESYD